MKKIKKCEVCNSNNLVNVLDIGEHPLCDDLIKIGSKRKNKKFPIKILYCKKCLTAHQKFQVPKVKLFPKSYHYRSRFTLDVLNGMENLVNSLESKTKLLKNKIILDIGCNDGSLLDKFRERGMFTIGVEPTGAYKEARKKKHVIFNDFFSKKCAKKIKIKYPKIDIITFTNVFAHIENLKSLLKAISTLMSEDTILVIENHYLGSILNKNQFDTFYHEHPRTYSLNSFKHIAKAINCKILSLEFPKRYGGNIRVILGKNKNLKIRKNPLINSTLNKELDFLQKFKQMNFVINSWKLKKKKELSYLIKLNGRLPAKAFPGRAAILIEMLNLSENEISCVYEKPGSAKIGNYVPGTKIPIRSDEILFKNLSKQKIILNLAWHIPEEIKNYLKSFGFKGELINIV